MGTKLEPGKYDCDAKAVDDEPKFTLLARDRLFVPLVERWAHERALEIDADIRADTPAEREQIDEAMDVVQQALAWRNRNGRSDG